MKYQSIIIGFRHVFISSSIYCVGRSFQVSDAASVSINWNTLHNFQNLNRFENTRHRTLANKNNRSAQNIKCVISSYWMESVPIIHYAMFCEICQLLTGQNLQPCSDFWQLASIPLDWQIRANIWSKTAVYSRGMWTLERFMSLTVTVVFFSILFI